MNKYHSKLAVRISALIFLSAGAGLLAGFGFWWEVFILAILICLTIYSLVKLTGQTLKDVKRLIGSIRFTDFSVSFRNVPDRGGDKELVDAMEQAIADFNARVQKQESELIFYEIMLSRIDFAIFAVNQRGEFKWVNKYAQEILGKPLPRHTKDLDRISSGFPGLLEGMTSRDIKVIRPGRGNNEQNLIVTMVNIQIKGESIRIFSLKNIQEVIDDTESEAWKKLIRILTHEMMNSITPIISLAETFSDPANESLTPEMMQKAMQTIYRRSEGLMRFVNNYQRLTRIPPPQQTTFPAEEMLEDICSLLKPQGIFFTSKVIPSGLHLFADRAQMEQVLINLIKNAAEACQNSPDPKVEIEIRTDEYQRTVLTVCDNGAGMLPEVQDKIFIPFFSTKKDGSGIGLSVCRQIVNNHGGRITLRSQPEKGSLFTIRI